MQCFAREAGRDEGDGGIAVMAEMEMDRLSGEGKAGSEGDDRVPWTRDQNAK